MIATINNEWITLSEQKNGVNVQRKFAGLDTEVALDNKVTKCNVKYWQRELYPNGEVIKTELKWYSLENLDEMINDIDGCRMAELNVLDGFVNTLGYSGIINPARETLENPVILPISIENGYPLRRDTREKIPLIIN